MPPADVNVSSSPKAFTTTHVVLAVLVTAGVIAFLMFQFGAKMLTEGGVHKTIDDEEFDDRPPVIITNGGSVHFDADQTGTKKGYWKPESGVWRHVVEGAPLTSVLLMSDDKGRKDGNCESKDGLFTNLNPPFAAPTMSVTFGATATETWETATFSINAQGELVVRFQAGMDPAQENYTLKRHKGNGSVKVRQVTMPGYVCTYGPSGAKIRIDQVK